MNNKITLSITGVITILLITIGITYAYFSANLTGGEEATTITVTGGTMNIVYNGGPNINVANIIPSDNPAAIKTFTVTGNNTTDIEMRYKVSLVVEENTFSEEALKYKLVSTNTNNNGTVAPNIGTGSKVINLGVGEFTSPTGGNKVHTYNLEIYFPNIDYNQNIDQGKEFKAHVIIENYIPQIIIASMFPTPVNTICDYNTLSTNNCIGEIKLFAFNFELYEHKKADGSLLPASLEYSSPLFNLLGVHYGGDGVNTFKIPDLTNSAPIPNLYYQIVYLGVMPDVTSPSDLSEVNFNYHKRFYANDNLNIGQIVLASGVPEDNGMLYLCDGKTYSTIANPNLFSLIGSTFGGDWATYFALPNLSSVTSPIEGFNYYIVYNGTYPIRN